MGILRFLFRAQRSSIKYQEHNYRNKRSYVDKPIRKTTYTTANSQRASHDYKRGEEIQGIAYVVDGDTIRINGQRIRLFGIDAPELDRPYGQKAKWHLVRLTKGHKIRAVAMGDESYDRVVAKCFLPDGSDLSEEMVRAGQALDFPVFSGGCYRHLEPAGIRKQLFEKAKTVRTTLPKELKSLRRMKENEVEIFSYCYLCDLQLNVSVDTLISRFGESFCLVGKVMPCQRAGCDGKAIFQAKPEENFIPLL